MNLFLATAELNWPTAFVLAVVAVAGAFLFSVAHTGRWPWDRN